MNTLMQVAIQRRYQRVGEGKLVSSPEKFAARLAGYLRDAQRGER